jgi:hypothetical protein
VESWFLKANDPRGRRALWLKWTVWAGDRAPERAVAEAWAIAFGTSSGHSVAKTVAPFVRADFQRHGLGVAVDGCTLSAAAARGRVESGGRSIGYDLALMSLQPPLQHLPAGWMYSREWPPQKVASPLPSALVSGTVDVGSERWVLAGWPGMVGHNWGRRHAEAYAWGHCNAWDGGEDLVFDGFTSRAGAIAPAVTVLCMRHRGVTHSLNGLLSIARSTGEITPRRWNFRGSARDISLEGEIWAETDDLVGLFYANPDGTMCHCLGSMLARAEMTVTLPGQAPRTVRSSRAALEIGTRDARHGVKMYA